MRPPRCHRCLESLVPEPTRHLPCATHSFARAPAPLLFAQAGPEPAQESQSSKCRTYKPCSNVNKLCLGTGCKKSQGASKSSEQSDRMAVGMYLTRHFGAEPLTKRSDHVDAAVKPLWAKAKLVQTLFHQQGEYAETVAASAVHTVRDRLAKAAPLPMPDDETRRRSSGVATTNRKRPLSTREPPPPPPGGDAAARTSAPMPLGLELSHGRKDPGSVEVTLPPSPLPPAMDGGPGACAHGAAQHDECQISV